MSTRTDVDNGHVALQALHYELASVKEEIQRCRQFRSRHTELGLPLKADASHDDVLAALHAELRRRRALQQELAAVQAERQSLAQAVAADSALIAALPERLRAVEEAASSLHTFFSLPDVRASSRLYDAAAERLPVPLYVLFSNAASYRDALDPSITLSIEGADAASAALALHRVASAKSTANPSQSEMFSPFPVHVTLNIPPTSQLKSGPVVPNQKSGTSSTSLSQIVTASTAKAPIVSLSFFYFPYLHVVSVAARLSDRVNTPTPSSPNTDLLRNILPDDSGGFSPNPANQWVLSSETNGKPLAWPNTRPDRPFRWAQWLAGLDFLAPPNVLEHEDQHLSTSGTSPNSIPTLDSQGRLPASWLRAQLHVGSVIGLIRCRAKSLTALEYQLQRLPLNVIPVPSRKFPLTPVTVMTHWMELSSVQFYDRLRRDFLVENAGGVGIGERKDAITPKRGLIGGPTREDLINILPPDGWAASQGARHFHSELQWQQTVRLEALVLVTEEYPLRAPLFWLRLLDAPSKLRDYASGVNLAPALPAGLNALADPAALKAQTDPEALRVTGWTPLQSLAVEINVHYDELLEFPPGAQRVPGEGEDVLLLSLQLRKLQTCLDIFCAATSSDSQTTDGAFSQVKLFLRPHRGKDRRLPFIFSPSLGLFDQRVAGI